MSFSLLKCYNRVIEGLVSSVTLQSWLREACGFERKSGFTQREREREKKKKKDIERILPLSYTERFAGRLEQIFGDGGESECRGGRGEISEQRSAHTSTTIFLCISRPPTTAQNSSKDILPSPSLSALIMVLSTICWSCVSFRLLPTIIFSTWKSSPLEM